MRLKGYSGPAQPSPLRVGALNAGYRNLEVKCVGCGTHNTVEPTITRRSKKRMRCKPCSEQRGYPYKRGQRLRCSKLTTKDDSEPGIPQPAGSQLTRQPGDDGSDCSNM